MTMMMVVMMIILLIVMLIIMMKAMTIMIMPVVPHKEIVECKGTSSSLEIQLQPI